MQEKMQFTAYLQGFVNIQDPRHLKTGIIFSFKMSLISFPIEDGKLEKTGAKSPRTHSKISITKMPRLKKRGKKSAAPHFLAFCGDFFAAHCFQNRILSFSVSL